MALWMEECSEPMTDSERADLDAIAALKESAAIELKEKGNEYVKMGKKHYADAIDCYTRAINQKILNDAQTSILFSNRAHVNLLLGNHRRSLVDAEEAIKLCSTNIKAFYRAAKAAFSLNLLPEAASFCQRGLELSPSNEELKKLTKQIDLRRSEIEAREAEVSKAISTMKDLASAIENRCLKLGKAVYQELTGLRKPMLDKDKILHWPVLLLYAEVMSSDFIEDFCETDMVAPHYHGIKITLTRVKLWSYTMRANNISAVWPWVVTNGIRDDPQQSKNGSVSSEDAGAWGGGWIVISHIARVGGIPDYVNDHISSVEKGIFLKSTNRD
ncbi:hypothetical protein ACLOJK_007745 [Asimina triloba]